MTGTLNNALLSIDNLQGGYADIQILNGVTIKVPENPLSRLWGLTVPASRQF